MTDLPWQAMAELWAGRIVNSLPAGLLVAAFAWAFLKLAGKRSSGTRFAVWFLALLTIVALPFLGGSAGSALDVTRPVAARFTLPASYATALFFAWGFFVLIALTRLAFGFRRIHQLRASCSTVVSDGIDPAMRALIENFSAERQVAIGTSYSVRVPTLMGFRKPTIVLPAWALSELSPDELSVILLHEFAHLRRRDAWTNLAQKVIRALFCFHPAVWFVESRLSLEREMACDDHVLLETGNPRAYAECLVAVAEKSFVQRGLALAQAAVSRMRETSLRLTRILDVERPAQVLIWKPALGIMAGFTGVCLALIPHAPTLVGFVPAELSISASASPPVPVTLAVTHRDAVQPPKPRVRNVVKYRQPENVVKAPEAVAVKTRSASPATTQIVQARARQNSAPQMWFVVQTVQFDGDGAAVWSLRVWRLTVFKPAQKPAVPARSTSIYLRQRTK